jgi:hypothetical protein
MAPVVPELLVRLSTMLSSPYQQVRECLGKAIQLCLSSDIQFQITNAQEYLTNTSDCFFLSPHSKSQMKKILDELTSIDFASIPADQLNKTKSLLCWFASCITSHLSVIMEPFLLFFTKISIKIQQSSDVDLNEMASQAAKLVPNYTHSIDQVHSEIMLFSEICISDLLIDQITESASWHTKCRVLPMLQVLFYKHLYFITPTLKKEVVNLLLFLIQDTHIQVRFINLGS